MSQLVRTNYRSNIARSDTTGVADATGLLTMSFPAGGGNLASWIGAQLASVPGLSTGLDYTAAWYVNPTNSFSGNISWAKIWMSNTSALNASVRVVGAAIAGSI